MTKMINIPEVHEVTTYRCSGVIYKSIDDLSSDLESKMGSIIDTIDVTLTPKQKLKIFNTLIENRSTIVQVLSIKFNNDYLLK